MKNTVSLIVIVAVAIAIGVALAVQLNQAPMVAQQLGMIIESQAKIDQKMTSIEEQQKKMLEIFESAKKSAERFAQQGGAGGQQAQRQMPPPEDLNKVYDIPVGASYIRGNPEAKVTIVQFTDIQCPFCQRFYTPILEVLKAYPNDVKFIVKNFPLSFHPSARPAAKAALAAGEQGKYWEMMDLLLEAGQQLTDENYKTLAGKIGISVEQFTADLKNNDAKYEKIINDDLQLGSSVDVRGTPAFYLNGKKTNAREFSMYKQEIDAILGKAGQ